MKPSPDESSENEPPMTRALYATDSDLDSDFDAQQGQGPNRPLDPDGTLVAESHGSPMGSDPELARVANSGLLADPRSRWPNSGDGFGPGPAGHRGVVGQIASGQILYSKYVVLRKLGFGAMGEVWLVRHVTLKSEHALKVIIPNFASNRVALMRFQRELEVMATLRQEHAVLIYDAFIDEAGGYIDMEFLNGRTLHEVIQEARADADPESTEPLMPLDWVVRILDQLCEVLQVAHAKGIVHRDLKPTNMMLLNGRKPGKECLKVLDFGIAKIRDDPESAVGREQQELANKTEGFIGTPTYASPEQAMARDDVDGRSDLYSVGIILYEFVTGRLPFRGNQWQVINLNANALPPSFAESNPRLRPVPELEHAILRVLSKDPNHRPSTALELFDEIRDAVEAVLPVGSPGITPPTWEVVPGYHPPSSTEPTEPVPPPSSSTNRPRPSTALLATEHEGSFESEILATEAEIWLSKSVELKPPKPEAISPSHLGRVVAVADAEPTRSRRLAIIMIITAVVVIGGLSLLGVGLILWVNRSMVDPNSGSIKTNEPGTRKTFEKYWSPDYLAVGDLGDNPIWPEKVRRTSDEVYFLRYAPGIYLPEGYQVEKPGDLADDGWPRVIVRDGVRFVRIVGEKEWVMGNWDAHRESERTDAPAHPVVLSGFYLQETEVTNGQFENYLARTQSVKPGDWDRVVTQLRRKVGADEARLHPAVCLSRKMALIYADFMDGQLPTEAQWEFAARSRGEKRHFVWGNTPTPNRDLANIDPQDARTTTPVRSFPKDQTVQGIYDMTGNVQEFCQDRWEPYFKTLTPVRDPGSSVPAGEDAVEFAVRGAAFSSYGPDCATTRRDDHRPSTELAENLGFRLVIQCPDTRKPRSGN